MPYVLHERTAVLCGRGMLCLLFFFLFLSLFLPFHSAQDSSLRLCLFLISLHREKERKRERESICCPPLFSYSSFTSSFLFLSFLYLFSVYVTNHFVILHCIGYICIYVCMYKRERQREVFIDLVRSCLCRVSLVGLVAMPQPHHCDRPRWLENTASVCFR